VAINPDMNFVTDTLPLSEKVSQKLQTFQQWDEKLSGGENCCGDRIPTVRGLCTYNSIINRRV